MFRPSLSKLEKVMFGLRETRVFSFPNLVSYSCKCVPKWSLSGALWPPNRKKNTPRDSSKNQQKKHNEKLRCLLKIGSLSGIHFQVFFVSFHIFFGFGVRDPSLLQKACVLRGCFSETCIPFESEANRTRKKSQ